MEYVKQINSKQIRDIQKENHMSLQGAKRLAETRNLKKAIQDNVEDEALKEILLCLTMTL